jgi:hypothetical protein
MKLAKKDSSYWKKLQQIKELKILSQVTLLSKSSMNI